MSARTSSGCISAARSVELTTSANSTVTSLSISAIGAVSSTAAPHAEQNRAPSGSSAPQFAHAAMAQEDSARLLGRPAASREDSTQHSGARSRQSFSAYFGLLPRID